MERLNFQVIEKKWQQKFSKNNLTNKKGKKYDYLSSYNIPANLDLMSIYVEDVFILIECKK